MGQFVLGSNCPASCSLFFFHFFTKYRVVPWRGSKMDPVSVPTIPTSTHDTSKKQAMGPTGGPSSGPFHREKRGSSRNFQLHGLFKIPTSHIPRAFSKPSSWENSIFWLFVRRVPFSGRHVSWSPLFCCASMPPVLTAPGQKNAEWSADPVASVVQTGTGDPSLDGTFSPKGESVGLRVDSG